MNKLRKLILITAVLLAFVSPAAANHGPVNMIDSPSGNRLDIDASGNAKATLGTTLACEDVANNICKVEMRFSYTNIATNATTVVKSAPGHLHCVIVNKYGGESTATVYDNSAGSGTLIATIDTSAAGPPGPFCYDGTTGVGLTVVTAGTVAANITVASR